MDSEFLMKKGKIAVSGDLLTVPQKKMNPLPRPSNSVAITEILQILTSPSLQMKQKNEHLLHWLNSFPHTLPNPSSIPLTDYLCWLLECHRLQQLPLSLQQAHWAELLELEYPLEQEAVPPTLLGISLVEEEDLEEDHHMVEDLLKVETQEALPIQLEIQELEEGEILQTLEEGEILLMANSPINY
jgi:hypothetical protein